MAADPLAQTDANGDFEWDGVYVGVSGTAAFLNPPFVFTVGRINALVGANVTSGDFLFGAEGWVSAYSMSFGSTGVGAGGALRAGMLISPDALLYVSAGAQFADSGVNFATVGLGTEFVVSENMTLGLEYKYMASTAFGGMTANAFDATLRWGF
ncbi:MAG: hypothetical protein GXP01_05040 [Alphaproteobacteria bacterium]|nr:hypothetical protein [Alphaproteobacteria bacterium]